MYIHIHIKPLTRAKHNLGNNEWWSIHIYSCRNSASLQITSHFPAEESFTYLGSDLWNPTKLFERARRLISWCKVFLCFVFSDYSVFTACSRARWQLSLSLFNSNIIQANQMKTRITNINTNTDTSNQSINRYTRLARATITTSHTPSENHEIYPHLIFHKSR